MNRIDNYKNFLKNLGASRKLNVISTTGHNIYATSSVVQSVLQKELASVSTTIEFTDSIRLYDTFAENTHHWTTDYCWNVVFPMISKALELDIGILDKFEKIENIYQGHDLSYHQFQQDTPIEFIDHIDNTRYTGDYSILRNYSDRKPTILQGQNTWFHRLYLGAHSISEVFNPESKSGRTLFINCDSMSIPLIPILVPFFSDIIAVDNRVNFNVGKLVEGKTITDYMCIMQNYSLKILFNLNI